MKATIISGIYLRFQNQEKLANIWLVLAIQTVMPVGYTILPLSAN